MLPEHQTQTDLGGTRWKMVPVMGWRGDVWSRQIEVFDALVGADTAAYVTDRYGTVANPAAPCRLRNTMHELAELVFERDGRYPVWWRAVGEEP